MLLLELSTQNVVWHAIRPEYAVEALTKNRLLATSLQRYDPTGGTLVDPNFNHNDHRSLEQVLADPGVPAQKRKDFERWYKSDWYSGMSLTRRRDFAKSWNPVVFELDLGKLKQRYQVIPWNWRSPKNRKEEAEEFLVVKKKQKDYMQKVALSGKKNDDNTPAVLNLNKYLLGIWLSKKFLERQTADIEKIKAHPLYKGEI